MSRRQINAEAVAQAKRRVALAADRANAKLAAFLEARIRAAYHEYHSTGKKKGPALDRAFETHLVNLGSQRK